MSKKIVVIAWLIGPLFLLIRCTGESSTIVVAVSKADIQKGQGLAVKYCQTCHQLPEPKLLDKETWRSLVLPVMGLFLGIKTPQAAAAPRTPGNDLDYLPDRPVIDSMQWRQIQAYFIASAPEHLPVPDRVWPAHDLPCFNIALPSRDWFSNTAIASYVKIDNSISPHRLIVNDGITRKLTILDSKAQKLKSYTLNGPVVDMAFGKDNIAVATIGRFLTANNFKDGDITEIKIDNKGVIAPPGQPIFERLARPVAVNTADLNQDGKMDYLIAQYGNLAGRLSWMENTGGVFKEHILREKPGCLKTIVSDANGDGLPDVWALFAQGDEGVYLYTNTGQARFVEKRVLRFPPSYGSSYFDLVDFNGDGFKDIIYTCGDNGDYSQILKPYHGIYIYLNDGKNNFSQKYFYPINGCYKAVASDFDGDGDLDIATISNFPAAITPWEAFIYFENKGQFRFRTYTLPPDVPFQKGLSMDAGDIDGDGKTDLLLGNGFYTSDQSGRYAQPLFIVLKNKSARAANNAAVSY